MTPPSTEEVQAVIRHYRDLEPRTPELATIMVCAREVIRLRHVLKHLNEHRDHATMDAYLKSEASR